MLRNVEDVAIELGVSKTSIYNKLKLKDYKDKVVKKQGISMIDDDLFKFIKDNLRCKPIVESKNKNELEDDEIVIDQTDSMNLNKELIESLLNQLNEKDKQISELHKLVENSQILLKEEKQYNQSKLLQEEHFKKFDLKIQSIMEEKREMQEKQNKSILNFFKRRRVNY